MTCAALAPPIDTSGQVAARHLERAFGAGHLVVRYQPLIGLPTGAITGVEAVLCWDDPVLGEVPREDFVPLAESCGLMATLGDWSLHEAFRQWQRWRALDVEVPRLSVKLSHLQLERSSFVSRVLRWLSDCDIPPAQVTFEVAAEALLPTNSPVPNGLIASLQQLRCEGALIALDAFTGANGSLAQLQRLPIDEIKIDPSLIHSLHQPMTSLLAAIVGVAHAMGWRTVAVGVEKEAQLDRLRACQCDEFQGDLIAPPLNATTLADVIRSASLQHRIVMTDLSACPD